VLLNTGLTTSQTPSTNNIYFLGTLNIYFPGTLDELCAEFFDYYCTRFQWESKAVSIRLGLTKHDSDTGCDRSQLSEHVLKEQGSGWFIEDPFDLCKEEEET
jgi:hypothetical protein